MGDLIGNAVEGTLFYAPRTEFERALSLDAPAPARIALFADMARLNALFMIARAGSGHIGSSFSSLDVMSWVLVEEMRARESGARPHDLYFSSKGHDAPGYYAAATALGLLPFELIHKLRRLGGLPGHPDVSTPGIVFNTGSLGMGISKAKGLAFANRKAGRDGRIWVMTGDGELQEGQIWESLASAANHGLHEITVLVDHNKLQSDTLVARTSDLGDLDAKFAAFGWQVERCDGHDLDAFAAVLRRLDGVHDRPKIVIADTIKGRGVSFMEHTAFDSDVELYKYHSGAPGEEAYVKAAQELIDGINRRLGAVGAPELSVETTERASRPACAASPQRMVGAYSQALIEAARRDERIVALDADLALDTGLLPFKAAFPDRFVECGIAEMDMVSQAGGMAAGGLLPVVHSFACFLATRPNEHIYNNATERRKVVYVASLAGLLPGGPGHSHQSVRDVAALRGVPGLALVEPSCEAEVEMVAKHCLHHRAGSSYIRLISIPCEVPYVLPPGYAVAEGRGAVLREGRDVILLGYGPVLLAEAWKAADLLAAGGVSARVVNLPWLDRVDHGWLAEVLAGARLLVTLDNHYLAGGQGEMVCAAIAEANLGGSLKIRRLGLADIPACGANDEVLKAHGLDAASIAATVRGT